MFATEWYKGTIASVNADADTYDVEYEDGDEMDKGLSRFCVRAYKPLEVDDLVGVRSENEYYNGRVVKVHSDGTVDIDTPSFGLFERVTTENIRRFDPEARLKEGSQIEALFQGEGDEWYPGVVLKVNADGTYDVEYEDGDTELGVKAANIREAP